MRRAPALLVVLTLLVVPVAGTDAASTGPVGVSVSGSFDHDTLQFSKQLSQSKSATTMGPVVTNCSVCPRASRARSPT
jgi:hypothetical protein